MAVRRHCLLLHPQPVWHAGDQNGRGLQRDRFHGRHFITVKGTYPFATDKPYNPNDPTTYPHLFTM